MNAEISAFATDEFLTPRIMPRTGLTNPPNRIARKMGQCHTEMVATLLLQSARAPDKAGASSRDGKAPSWRLLDGHYGMLGLSTVDAKRRFEFRLTQLHARLAFDELHANLFASDATEFCSHQARPVSRVGSTNRVLIGSRRDNRGGYLCFANCLRASALS
jgi:hypothetical protein